MYDQGDAVGGRKIAQDEADLLLILLVHRINKQQKKINRKKQNMLCWVSDRVNNNVCYADDMYDLWTSVDAFKQLVKIYDH